MFFKIDPNKRFHPNKRNSRIQWCSGVLPSDDPKLLKDLLYREVLIWMDDGGVGG